LTPFRKRGPEAGSNVVDADVLAGPLFGGLPKFLLASGGQQKSDTVELCLSNADECPQAGGVSPSSISVYRWDNMHDNQLVWDAEPKNSITAGSISGVVAYGVVPKDWINKLTPPALTCGKAYLVNPGAHYFALKCDGTVVVFDDPHLEEFFGEYTGTVALNLKTSLGFLDSPPRVEVVAILRVADDPTKGLNGECSRRLFTPSWKMPTL
jgi:hypothetical protein